MPQRPIMVISGTNRPSSSAMMIARVMEAHYRRADVLVDVLGLDQLPRDVFEPAAYASKPAAFAAIQQRVLDAAGLHVVVPEYNGSFPGVLKYFIDMLKFPESFEHKPVAFVGESSGAWGALRAVEQLQHVFGYRNAHIFPTRVFIAGVHTKLDASGKLLDDEIDQRLAKQAKAFAQYVRRLTAEGT